MNRSKQKTVIFFCFINFLSAFSQIAGKYEFHAGYGFYETVNVGANYLFNRNIQKAGISIGFDNFIQNSETYFAISLEHNLAVFRKKKRQESLYKWYVDSKSIYWHLKDSYYNWDVVSLSPSLQRIFYFTDKLFMSVDAGPMFNIVLHNKRKTLKEIGWPYHVMPDIRVLLAYRI